MRIPESELIINSDGSAFHIHIRPEELAGNVILVGDPSRVGMVAPMLDSIECQGSSREFVWATGRRNGKRLTVLSTGIGTDNIDIVMTELDSLANIDYTTREVKEKHTALNILRVGTCGAVQPDIPLGSFVLSHMSIGCDGLLNWYADRDSICDLEMEKAFTEHVGWDKNLPRPYFVRSSDEIIRKLEDATIKGLTVSASGFYGPQGRVVRLPLAMPDMIRDFESFRHNGWRVTNFEMESSALAGLGAKLGHNVSTVCCVIANRHLKQANADYKPRVRELCELVMDRI